MFKKILFLFIAVLLIPITSLQANEGNEQLEELLVIAKFHGMCGVFHQLASFQKSTQMVGGNEFFLRFTNT